MPLPIDTMFDSTADFRFEPDQWLWCLHCSRFFQGRDAREDSPGSTQGCAFEECDGAGYGCDILDWDAWPTGDPAVGAVWPTEDQLFKGLRVDPCELLPGGQDPESELRESLHDTLLELACDPDLAAVTLYPSLDHARLARLVAKGGLSREHSLNSAPPARDVLNFLRRWPCVRACAVTVREMDGSERVTLEGIECSLDGVLEAQRADLRSEFAALGKDGEHTDGGWWLRVWWR